MSGATAASGFVWPLRVYWEDTDGGGVVFHANYLRYLERARTEWCRAAGFEQSTLAAVHQVLFSVVDVELSFRAPARLDDQLAVTVAIEKAGRASLVLAQQVRRGAVDGELLLTGRVRVGCVDARTFRPRGFPEDFRRMVCA
jgi:acyl-CoA thioester hydrolase